MLPQTWRNWIISNLMKGVDASVLLNTLLDNGFNFGDCKRALGSNLAKNTHYHKNAEFYAALAAPKLLSQLQQLNAQVVEQERAQVIKIDGFLNAQECNSLVQLTKTTLRPSTITEPNGYEGFRTSTTCDLSCVKDALVAGVEQKIIKTLGAAIPQGEVMQAQHYAVGQQFKAHTDYFEPGTKEFLQFAKNRGQRTWTFMIYLNEGCEGGQTEFPQLGLTFQPTLGSALIWNNLLVTGHPNPNTLHQSHPVIRGEKIVITKWFRDQ